MLVCRVVADPDPDDAPDAAQDAEEVEDPFPAELVGQDAAQKEGYDRSELSSCNI